MGFPIKVNDINIANVRELSALAEKDCEAQNILGEMFFGGDGVPRDIRKATACFIKAADRGSSQAMMNLGFLNAKGIGCVRNCTRAERLYTRAAMLGAPEAYVALCEQYYYGMGQVEQDFYRGMYYALKAIDAGMGEQIATMVNASVDQIKILAVSVYKKRVNINRSGELDVLLGKLRNDQGDDYNDDTCDDADIFEKPDIDEDFKKLVNKYCSDELKI